MKTLLEIGTLNQIEKNKKKGWKGKQTQLAHAGLEHATFVLLAQRSNQLS